MAATAQNHMEPLRSGDGKKDEDRDDELEYSPFYGIEKGAVLQEARVFNEAHADPRRCQQVITKLLYLLTQGESLTKTEASDVFFAVTKLFQHKDVHLRRMVYLVIKEVIPASDEVIIITSSLMKDMNSSNELYRANAIRVLCRIIDPTMLLQIERYLKQAVVDKSAVVATAVLAGATLLSRSGADVIKRWTSEIGEAMASRQPMVTYHAVALTHALRAADRLAVNKLVTQLTRGGNGVSRSPMAQCLLVRYVAQVVVDSSPGAGGAPRPFFDYLESCLRHKSEVVIFEAARAICALRDVTARELTPAVTVLQLFLSSAKPVLRFAAVRTLNRVAMAHPLAVTNCNIDMEGLISDPNRSVATLAITTLLKTSNESSIDRLLKQIGGFMGEIGDEFKVVVVEAITALCLKFPAKHRGLMAFLAAALREDGGHAFKRAVAAALTRLVAEIPEAREAGLAQLAEFIEDCEFTSLSVQILHLLGREGPTAPDPARFVRVIYNRVALENATVRGAALAALCAFGVARPELRRRVAVLMRRALHDADDEVRDRATLYLARLEGLLGERVESGDEGGASPGAKDAGEGRGPRGAESPPPAPPATPPPMPEPRALEAALREYLAAGATEAAFDLGSVRAAAPAPRAPRAKAQGLAAATAGGAAAAQARAPAPALASVPQLAALGPVFKTSAPIQLTEEETEYKVDAVAHVLADRVVLAFTVVNTVAEQVLEGVSVDLGLEEGWQLEASLPLASAPHDVPGTAYAVLRRPPGAALPATRLGCTLRFVVKEIDPGLGEPEEEGYEDEYSLEDLELGLGCFVAGAPAPAGFRALWDSLPEDSERVDDYALGARESLADAARALGELFNGFAPVDGSDAVPPGARSHALLLAGALPDGGLLAVRLALGLDRQRNVAMKLAVRASDGDLAEAVHAVVQDA
uniref:Coatomer subunit gamma n=1 Tax=Auxenochlorella protothecoides TaxID=3075 RepID=A0A1D2AB45_AUXPR